MLDIILLYFTLLVYFSLPPALSHLHEWKSPSPNQQVPLFLCCSLLPLLAILGKKEVKKKNNNKKN